MVGAMQDWDLVVTHLIDHAAREYGEREHVTRWADGTETRTTWADVRHDALRRTQALRAAPSNDLPTQLALEARLQGYAGRTADFREGVAAFVQGSASGGGLGIALAIAAGSTRIVSSVPSASMACAALKGLPDGLCSG